MKKILSTALFVLITCCLSVSQAQQIEVIDPPFWWAGMPVIATAVIIESGSLFWEVKNGYILLLKLK